MRNAEKVTVTLMPDLLQSVRDTVEAGEFATASEALNDAVRVWQRQRLEEAERTPLKTSPTLPVHDSIGLV